MSSPQVVKEPLLTGREHLAAAGAVTAEHFCLVVSAQVRTQAGLKENSRAEMASHLLVDWGRLLAGGVFDISVGMIGVIRADFLSLERVDLPSVF